MEQPKGLQVELLKCSQQVRRWVLELVARLNAAQIRNECPECGLTPGTISTCFCEECVEKLKQDLAECRRLLREACKKLDTPMPFYSMDLDNWYNEAARAAGGVE